MDAYQRYTLPRERDAVRAAMNATLINCRHETDADGEWTCNLPEYVCDYRRTYATDPPESYLRSLSSERRLREGISDATTGNSGDVTSLENASMAEADDGMADDMHELHQQIRRVLPRTVRGMVVQDTRTGMWGTVNSGIEWASGQTVVRIQESVTDLQWWAPTSALVLI